MFDMKLIAEKPLEQINQEYEAREYSEDLDDGRSVIMDICEIFEETKEIKFIVSGFGQEPWCYSRRIMSSDRRYILSIN